jgi:transposase
VHRVAITRLRCHPETKVYIARKRVEGKTSTEAIRCLKRRLTRASGTSFQPPPLGPLNIIS